MKNRAKIIAIIIIVIFAGLIFTLILLNTPQKITFAECESIGGEPWLVNLYHPDICPQCTNYFDCLEKKENAGNTNMVCYAEEDCGQCIEKNFPYPEKCPGGQEKLAEISDAAIWFLCCR